MTSPSQHSLGARIRQTRIDAGIGLRELARLTGKAPSYLTDIENDRRVPSEAVLADLARILELPFDELLTAAGRMGADAEQLVKTSPAAGVMFRRVASAGLDEQALQQLDRQTERWIQRQRRRDQS